MRKTKATAAEIREWAGQPANKRGRIDRETVISYLEDHPNQTYPIPAGPPRKQVIVSLYTGKGNARRPAKVDSLTVRNEVGAGARGRLTKAHLNAFAELHRP